MVGHVCKVRGLAHWWSWSNSPCSLHGREGNGEEEGTASVGVNPNSHESGGGEDKELRLLIDTEGEFWSWSESGNR